MKFLIVAVLATIVGILAGTGIISLANAGILGFAIFLTGLSLHKIELFQRKKLREKFQELDASEKAQSEEKKRAT